MANGKVKEIVKHWQFKAKNNKRDFLQQRGFLRRIRKPPANRRLPERLVDSSDY